MKSYLSETFWKGHTLQSYQHLTAQHVEFTLSAKDEALCPKCQRSCTSFHDTKVRRIRDCDILGYKLTLLVPLRRVACQRCGVHREHISWLQPHSRLTNRLVTYIEELCKVLPIKHVAELLGLSWHTVRNIECQRLKREEPPIDFSKVRHLMMDEFALRKGHNYASVIADADTKQVLWIGVGRTREAIRPFFKQLGKHCVNIEAVAMDQNTAFDLEVREHCANAQIVYDLFHVIAKYGREVIDRVRVDQANEVRENKPERRAIKRSRWLLLRNREKLDQSQTVKLQELMTTNRPIAEVYILKELLKEIWRSCSIQQAQQRWSEWWKACHQTDIKPLHDFARRLKPYLHGIVSSAKYRLNTSVLEGMNNKIKVIKRNAYGYRDHEYFFLRIKHAFPGVQR